MQPPGEGWWSLKVLWKARVNTIKGKKVAFYFCCQVASDGHQGLRNTPWP